MHRVGAVADLHGFLPEIPPCDLLVVAGDVCPATNHSLDFQRRWLEGPFSDWLDAVPAETIVGIAGNHDFIAEADPELMRRLPWCYLSDETTEAAGLTIHGSPWVPTFGGWAFMDDDQALSARWAQIPETADILVVHGPPLGHGDLTVNGRHAGSATLARRLEELPRLRLHVFGHIHEGGGSRSHIGSAQVANVSYVDFDYRPAQPPAVFEL